MATMHTTMIRASITAYSTAVGPSSFLRNWTSLRLRVETMAGSGLASGGGWAGTGTGPAHTSLLAHPGRPHGGATAIGDVAPGPPAPAGSLSNPFGPGRNLLPGQSLGAPARTPRWRRAGLTACGSAGRRLGSGTRSPTARRRGAG